MTVLHVHNDGSLYPGPIDNSVLVLQHKHRSGAIWEEQDPGVLTCRQRLATMMRQWPLDQRIRHYIIQSGFYGVYRVGFIQLDWALITALVERWREETHTFHLAVGEATVTLQDAAVLLGLRVNGDAVIGSGDGQWGDLCEDLLGLRPAGTALQGSALKLSWLRDNFLQPPPDADDVTLQRYARAYILGLMGGSLFADKSGSDVHLIFLPLLRDFAAIGQLSWGSATLAHLYRELCRASRTGAIEIAGPLILLQLWAWERLHIGRPDRLAARAQDANSAEGEGVGDAAEGVAIDEEPLPADPLGCRWRVPLTRKGNPSGVLIFYRDQLDQQRDDQMIWQPYTPEILAVLPHICIMDQHLWRTVAPLICFDIIEWHRPDRVLRQFGLFQGIPEHCDTSVALHAIDRRGRHHCDWRDYHAHYVKLWEDRELNIIAGELEERPMRYFDPYMEWYRKITRRFITPFNRRSHMRFQPTGGATHLLVQNLTTIYDRCTSTLHAFTNECAVQALTDIQTMCSNVLKAIDEGHALAHAEASSSSSFLPLTPAMPPPLLPPSAAVTAPTATSPCFPPSMLDSVDGVSQPPQDICSQAAVQKTATSTDSLARGGGGGGGRGQGSAQGVAVDTLASPYEPPVRTPPLAPALPPQLPAVEVSAVVTATAESLPQETLPTPPPQPPASQASVPVASPVLPPSSPLLIDLKDGPSQKIIEDESTHTPTRGRGRGRAKGKGPGGRDRTKITKTTSSAVPTAPMGSPPAHVDSVDGLTLLARRELPASSSLVAAQVPSPLPALNGDSTEEQSQLTQEDKPMPIPTPARAPAPTIVPAPTPEPAPMPALTPSGGRGRGRGRGGGTTGNALKATSTVMPMAPTRSPLLHTGSVGRLSMLAHESSRVTRSRKKSRNA